MNAIVKDIVLALPRGAHAARLVVHLEDVYIISVYASVATRRQTGNTRSNDNKLFFSQNLLS
jgi:hypothetical protein